MSAPATIASTNRLLTKEDYEALPQAFHKYELVDGYLAERPPMGIREAQLNAVLVTLLNDHLGRPLTREVMSDEARFWVSRNPDVIRGCDVSYTPADRLPPPGSRVGVADFVPALAVEVLSPSNIAIDTNRKVSEWLAAGVDLVWVIDEENGRVDVYAQGQRPRVLGMDDTLDGGSVLPGLSIALRDLLRPGGGAA